MKINSYKMSKQYFHSVILKVLWLVLTLHVCENVAFCPSGCQCDDVGLTVQCVNVNLDTVPILLNPGTKHLDLSHNHIKSVMSGFTFYHEMQFLSIAHNEIVSLGHDNFVSQGSLTTLVISNNKIRELHDRTFDGLHNLKEIDLSDNYINFISNMALNPLINLRILDLSNNKLSNFTNYTFKALKGLKILNLCKNRLRNISEEVFDYLVELQELHLCSNELTHVDNSIFRNLKNLVHLSVFSNRLLDISPQSLKGLENLKLLDIHDNLLNEVPIQALSSLAQLEELNIGTNSLEILQAGSFKELKHMRNLYISHCSNLSRLEVGAFHNLVDLLQLEISFNEKLININAEVFQPLAEVTRLVLRGNSLQTIDQRMMTWLKLQYLDIRDNKLVCNCSMKWLEELQKNKSLVVKVEEVLCEFPESLRGRMLSNLTEYELECYSRLLIAVSCIAVTITVIILSGMTAFIYFRYFRKMKTLVHDHWPEKIVATWRDPEYEKQIEDDDYTFQSTRSISHIQIPVI